MWNFSALAAKAQEAAARIERQLDDSVGIKDDTKSTLSASTTTSASNFAATIHEEDTLALDDNDDFFSDDHHHKRRQDDGVPTYEQLRLQGHNFQGIGNAVTKLQNIISDAGVTKGSELLEDDMPSQPPLPPQYQESSSNDEQEIDFGEDNDIKDTGDGWDDADEIPLDDDDDENENSTMPPPMGVVEEPTMSEEPESVAVVDDETEVFDLSEAVDDLPTDNGVTCFYGPIADDEVVAPEMAHDHIMEMKPSAEEVQPTDNENAEISAELNLDEESSNESIRDNHYPADIQEDSHLLNNEPIEPSSAETLTSQTQTDDAPSMDDIERKKFLDTIVHLESQLYQREEQLAFKSNQITTLSLQHESESAELRQAISTTKEEAKKRILRAKERVDEMQSKLTEAVRRADAAGGSSQEQSDIISALRAEGEKLAKKQSQMEQLVRNARGEARDLQEQLDVEKEARAKEVAKVESLTLELKSVKEELTLARKGESQSKKLEADLLTAKEESEKQRAANIGLEQQVKELKDANKTLKKEVQDARAGAALELEGESNKLRKERNDMLEDLESKLRTSEREANVREDALRHEVSELRKRWQDAVRRAEDLSMDVQHSTAPLLRQLESTERQNRARAAAWAEVETKLRSELEDHVIRLEKLSKERNELVTNDKRSQRFLKEKDEEISSLRETIDALSATIESLESKVEMLDAECSKSKQDAVEAERKVSEGASRVRNEMMKTLVESEERYRAQIEMLEDELEAERQRRNNIEKQLDDLAGSVAAAEFAQNDVDMREHGKHSPARAKKLRKATDQASILQDTLAGFDSDVDDDDDDEGVENGTNQVRGNGSSFAAMEQLSLGLKGARIELVALRKQLKSSEDTRESLLEELGEARQAAEKLPLFEQKVSDLTMELRLKEMEIQGLRDDIADVRFLYRSQLDALLEEKAVPPVPSSNESEKGANNVVTVIYEST